jgi:hypothetical protein
LGHHFQIVLILLQPPTEFPRPMISQFKVRPLEFGAGLVPLSKVFEVLRSV